MGPRFAAAGQGAQIAFADHDAFDDFDDYLSEATELEPVVQQGEDETVMVFATLTLDELKALYERFLADEA